MTYSALWACLDKPYLVHSNTSCFPGGWISAGVSLDCQDLPIGVMRPKSTLTQFKWSVTGRLICVRRCLWPQEQRNRLTDRLQRGSKGTREQGRWSKVLLNVYITQLSGERWIPWILRRWRGLGHYTKSLLLLYVADFALYMHAPAINWHFIKNSWFLATLISPLYLVY